MLKSKCHEENQCVKDKNLRRGQGLRAFAENVNIE